MRWTRLRLVLPPSCRPSSIFGDGPAISFAISSPWSAAPRHPPVHTSLHRRRRSTIKIAFSSTAFGDPLINFVRSSGGQVGKGVTVEESGHLGCGLFALHPCESGTILVSLPPKAQLSYDVKSTDERLLNLIDSVPTELWGGKLALVLLHHRVITGTPEDHFADYIAALPNTYPGLPIFFSDEAVKALEYPPVTVEVIRRCRWLINFSGQVLAPFQQQINKNDLDPFSGVLIDSNILGWGLAAVTSRAFRPKGTQHPACMLPLIDMANHSFTPNCKIMLSKGGELNMIAARDIVAGEQLCIDYGPWPNDYFLLDYGFIVPDNPHDNVLLKFDRSLIEAAKGIGNVPSQLRDDGTLLPLPSWQKKALESIGIDTSSSGNSQQVAIRQHFGNLNTCPVEDKLLAGVRILCSTQASELKGTGAKRLCDWNRPLTLKNELAALKTLLGICAIALSQFSTTDAIDMELLKLPTPEKKHKLPKDVELAVRFRLEKKRLLTRAMTALSSRVKELPQIIDQAQDSTSSTGQHKGFGPTSG